MLTKFDVYVVITIPGSIPLLMDRELLVSGGIILSVISASSLSGFIALTECGRL